VIARSAGAAACVAVLVVSLAAHARARQAAEESAHTTAQRAMGELTAVRGMTADPQAGKQLDFAIDRMLRSLQLDLWIDVNHVDPKRGERVFSEEREALAILRGLGGKKMETPPPALLVLSARLAQVLRTLASVAAADVQRAGDAGTARKALDDIGKGDRDVLSARFVNAADHYYAAWARLRR